MSAGRLVHVTTTDMSLDWLLGPQLSAFADAGYEVFGVSAPGPHVQALERRGIRHVPLRHASRAMTPGRDLLALRELGAVLKRLRPDIVHTHNPKPGIYGRIAARSVGVPVVVNTVHGLYALPEDRWTRRRCVYALEHLASRASDAELVQNIEDLRTLARIGVPPMKLHLLGNGIDLGRFDPDSVSPETRARVRARLGVGVDEVLCGAVGRLVREKGYPELIASYAEVRARAPQVRLVIVGPRDPDKADGLSEPALEAARAAGVILLGPRDDLVELYAAMDLYVLASRREGFPRSAMEAAAMGLPVVATDIRGCRQVVEDGRTGLLVPPGEVPSLTEALLSLSTDAAWRRSLGAAARSRARREFDQQTVIDLTLEVYRRLSQGRAGRATDVQPVAGVG